MMHEPQKVTAFLKITAEFYDPEATPETVRYAVEQDLEDAGYEVEVVPFDKGNNVPCKSDVPDINAGKWISVKDRLPKSAGVATLVTAVNTHGQKCVFEAFLGYGDMHWYTLGQTGAYKGLTREMEGQRQELRA